MNFREYIKEANVQSKFKLHDLVRLTMYKSGSGSQYIEGSIASEPKYDKITKNDYFEIKIQYIPNEWLHKFSVKVGGIVPIQSKNLEPIQKITNT